MHEAEELLQILRYHRDERFAERDAEVGLRIGGGAVLLTLAPRHHRGTDLAERLGAMAGAWGRVTRGRPWAAERKDFGVTDWRRGLEITWSCKNGDHPHYHVLILLDTPVSWDMADSFGWRVGRRWAAELAKVGVECLPESGGVDCRPCDLGDESDDGVLARYLTKTCLEVTASTTKEGRDGSFSLAGLVRHARETYEAEAIEALWAIEDALEARPTRFVTTSRSWADLRRAAGLDGAEASDEEVAEQEVGGEDVIAIDAESWPALHPQVPELLQVIESCGVAAGMAWLTVRRIGWRPAGPRRYSEAEQLRSGVRVPVHLPHGRSGSRRLRRVE